jgi:hypothetical protein
MLGGRPEQARRRADLENPWGKRSLFVWIDQFDGHGWLPSSGGADPC